MSIFKNKPKLASKRVKIKSEASITVSVFYKSSNVIALTIITFLYENDLEWEFATHQKTSIKRVTVFLSSIDLLLVNSSFLMKSSKRSWMDYLTPLIRTMITTSTFLRFKK